MRKSGKLSRMDEETPKMFFPADVCEMNKKAMSEARVIPRRVIPELNTRC